MQFKENNQKWDHIFNRLNIDPTLDDLDVYISAKDITESSNTWKGEDNKFECRLLCQVNTQDKFRILKDNGIVILSAGKKGYHITKKKLEIELDYSHKPDEIIILKRNKTSTILGLGNSETSMLDNFLFAGGFSHIISENIEKYNLLSGRHRLTTRFKFNKKDKYQLYKSVQFETDVCHETRNNIILVEAKNKKFEKFNIKQLYFPYKYVFNEIYMEKSILPIFICRDNNLIHCWVYSFSRPDIMLSHKLEKHYVFKFEDNDNIESDDE